jgi:hypothetical protein
MHISGSVEFSTFRKTLDAILRRSLQLDRPDHPRFDAWMAAHLRVKTWACDDADTLGQVEAGVLRLLDPPLNLMGMNSTPLRSQLKDSNRAASALAPTTSRTSRPTHPLSLSLNPEVAEGLAALDEKFGEIEPMPIGDVTTRRSVYDALQRVILTQLPAPRNVTITDYKTTAADGAQPLLR